MNFYHKLQSVKQRIKHKLKLSRRKIDFIIIGVQKSGTTALDSYLRGQHHQICMADYKELHYFDTDNLFTNGQPDYCFYQSFFSPKKSHQIIGETTPIYLYWRDALKRISHYNSDIKLIVLLRNPIERAYSHWNMSCDNGKEDLGFLSALKAESARAEKQAPEQLRTHSYIDRGLYVKQLKTLWQHFPKNQTLVLKSSSDVNEPIEKHIFVKSKANWDIIC
ncbi:MAG: sulfotransferase domain-containing protein, partial [Candidatus Thioglobus sp.]